MEEYFKNDYYRFLEEAVLLLLAVRQNLQEKAFSCGKKKIQILTQNLLKRATVNFLFIS